MELPESKLQKDSNTGEIPMDRLKQQAKIDRTKRLLEYLYGDMPKAVFQRLMSIEPNVTPDRIPYP